MPDYSKTRIQFRRGTAAEFASANPVLASGEPAFAVNTNTLKIGDGETAYSSLSAIAGGGGGGISNVVEDTSPQLGGNLDLNSKDITGEGDILSTGSGNFDQGVFVSGDPAVKSSTSSALASGSLNVSGVTNMVITDLAGYSGIAVPDDNTIYFIV